MIAKPGATALRGHLPRRPSGSAPVAEAPNATGTPSARCIVGIDPGSTVTGYAFLRAHGPRAELAIQQGRPLMPQDFIILDAGVLRVDPKAAHSTRLGLLHAAMHSLFERHRPEVCVLEKAFAGKNISSAIKLGEMRGAYIAACARAAVQIEEITPAEVKKTITGNGRAEKEQVSLALRSLTGFVRGGLPHDVTDALAIGLCYGLRLAPRWMKAYG